MKKLKFLILVAVVSLVASAVATADQGRRLTPPVCIGKAGLAPVQGTTIFGQKVTVPRAGQMRSVAKSEACRSDEQRGYGVALRPLIITKTTVIKGTTRPGPAGATGTAGKDGLPGAKGETGATGATGAKGETGATGATGPRGYAGPQGVPGAQGEQGAQGEKGEQGAPGEQGAKGEDGLPGAQGEKGDKGNPSEKGDPGLPGEKGDKGEKGDPGTPGLGTGVIYACVSNGGSLQRDVNGHPCDNEGHQPIKLVVVSP